MPVSEKNDRDLSNKDVLLKLSVNENCANRMLTALESDVIDLVEAHQLTEKEIMSVLCEDVQMKKLETDKLSTRLEDFRDKRAMIEGEVDVVNCGIGMSSINIKRDVTKQEVRDLVHDDSGSPYQKFKAYIRMMDNPRVKLHKIRFF